MVEPKPARKSGNALRRERIDDPDLWRFFRDGRLETIPAARPMRRRALEHVAARFDGGRDYSEREVNAILFTLHSDVASLRRYLVDEGLLARDHGIYRRT
ncbi:MAG: DUF2087 domain-containing protein [Candidatus Limnocylindria bacterium]